MAGRTSEVWKIIYSKKSFDFIKINLWVHNKEQLYMYNSVELHSHLKL